MSEISERKLITIPKFSDRWLEKITVVFGFLFLAYLFATPGNVKYYLAITAGYVLIIDKELRYRAMMINIMDNQLINVSAQANRLEEELENTSQKLLELGQELEILKSRND